MPYLSGSGTFESAQNDMNSVAIIGFACRFPGEATDVERFWELLCKARSAYSEPDRFNIHSFHSNTKGKLNTSTPKGAHFLRQDVAAFDANFFSINQSEAMAMDPQQRIMLEIAYEAFENAGLPLDAIAGTDTSCYVGNFTNDYREMLFRDPESAPLYSLSGSGSELISNRISWFYDLRGPSFTLGTACSSSLVALHQACQSLRTRESNMAMVGGSNLLLSPDMFLVLSNQQFLAQDGRCKSFDAKGDGYGRGEGFAAVVLKRIDDAIRDGDPIRAVIRGTGVNQDGKTKGITVPSADAQAELIRSTYRSAGIDFRDTHYFEAHGTGTKAGDPLELEAISNTLGSVRESNNKIIVGSVKSNIGHLEATAGLAGLIKGIYMLERALIPANIHFEQANPRIPFEKWKIAVPTETKPWPIKGLRRLSVQAFGYGGTNAHAVLDDAFHYLAERKLQGIHFTESTTPIDLRGMPTTLHDYRHISINPEKDPMKLRQAEAQKRIRLFVFSAQDQDGLNRQRENFSKYLEDRSLQLSGAVQLSNHYLRNLAFTLSKRRSRLAWKTYMTASSIDELLAGLKNKSSEMPSFRSSGEPTVGFIFTGQGAQWSGMGDELSQYRVFRESLETADEYLRTSLGCSWSAVEELRREAARSKLDLPAYSQPLCTVLQIALVDLLESWNIVPSVMAGHSSGEIAAAYCLGALTKEDALKVAYYRGLLSSQMKVLSPSLQGAMLAVGASESEAQDWINQLSCGDVVVACINSPSSVTISGSILGIAELETLLKQEGIFARTLKVETAYHSPHMEMISASYLETMKDVKTQDARESRKMYSAVTGGSVDASELGPVNWVRNLVSPVLFYDAVHDLLRPMQADRRATETAVDLLLEIGPHSTLQGAINQIMKKHGINDVAYCSVLSRGRNGVETALAAAGALFAQGVHVNMSQLNNETGDAFKGSPRPLVDLPSYCWNHSRTFWAESRISKQYRFREHPRYSVLGAPCSSFDEKGRFWRGFQRTSEEPWVRDHKIQTSILYPAAGYIAMAVEAACQIAAEGRVIRDFKLRDIQIIAPAVVTEESDLECIFQLRPHLVGTRDSHSTWWEFSVSTCANGQDLRQNCLGLLLIEYQSTEAGMVSEMNLEDQAVKDLYREAKEHCQTSEDPKDFYRDLQNLGLDYGPRFQNISHIRRGDGQSCCAVDISDPGFLEMSGQIDRPHVIHPTNLDAMFHAVFAAFKGQLKEAMVPKSIDEMTISANIPFKIGARFEGFSNVSKHGFRELMADLVMLDKHSNRPAVTVKGFCCAAISGTNRTADDETELTTQKLFSKIIWKPSVELLSSDQKRELINAAIPGTVKPESAVKIVRLEMLAFFYIRHTLERVPIGKVSNAHLEELYRWMQEQQNLVDKRAHPSQALGEDWYNLNDQTARLLEADIATDSAVGEALCLIGTALERIVIGKADAAQLLLENGLMDRLLGELQGPDGCFSKLSEFVQLTAHTNPNLSILELGNAAGAAALSIIPLAAKCPNDIPLMYEYVYSSPNDRTLKKAEEQLEPWKAHIKFKSLDVERDPLSQGFDSGTVDIIIVSHLSDAAQDPEKTLIAAKKLLKPGGKLCLTNATNPGMRLSIVLRFLPSCQKTQGENLGAMKPKALEALLKRHDFAPDFIAAEFKDTQDQQLSVIVATAMKSLKSEAQVHEITILEASNPSHPSQRLAARLAFELGTNSIKTTRIRWNTNSFTMEGKVCISLIELETSILEHLGEGDFTAIKQLILHSSSLLWITALNNPAGGLVSGMARSIRNEIPGIQFRTLTVPAKSLDSPDQLAPLIGKLATTLTSDDEFLEKNGIIEVSRVVEDSRMNEEWSRQLMEGKDRIDFVPLEQVGSPQKLAIRAQGMLDTLCLETDEGTESELGNDEVEIEVKATGLNFRDVMVTMGQIPDNLLGFEASGTIVNIGADVKGFKAGDRVCTIGHGAHRTLFRNKAGFCQAIPVGYSFEEAATLPLVHCTAFYSLVHIARVRQGQTILIHAAAGGVGQAAIQLAKHFGLEIYATVGSADKKQLVKEVYGVPDDHIFNSRDLSFSKGVLRMTNGRGVDCIINSLSGEALRQSWYCIAPFGTFVEIGMKDILSNTGLEMRPFLQDASFTFFNLKHVLKDNPTLMIEIIEGTFDFLRRGVTRPVSPLTVYPISEVENAFRLMQTGKHRGKIALTWAGKDIVPVLCNTTSTLKLDENATYVLVGGLGGLGRSLSTLLVELGARHLCFISRSGRHSDNARELIQELEKTGVQIKVCSCDIADQKALAKVFRQCSHELPRVKGVFQCAMVLRDTLFEKMTYQQWKESLRPKVEGSWNIHLLSPQDLDFFITLSSFSGIFGNRSQSNYAAAGTYQDALAYYRRSQGLKAVTIDLGIMRDVGVIAEYGATDYLKEWEEPFGIRELDFHLMIKQIIASEQTKTTATDGAHVAPQLLTGFATGEMVQRAGIRRPFYFDDVRFSILAKTGLANQREASSSVSNGTIALRDQLAQVKSLPDAARAVTDALVARVARSLQTATSEIDENRPLHSYGVDSLVAVEISNWVFKEVKVTMSVFDLLATMSIATLTGKIAAKSPFLAAGLGST